MKQSLMTTLRDKRTDRQTFRYAATQLARLLAARAYDQLPKKNISIETPLAHTQGTALACDVTLVPILRSGIALLPAFLATFQDARVGVVGLKRDEATAQAQWYYDNIPSGAAHDHIIILDPMIATAGTALEVLKKLTGLGVPEDHIVFVAVICAQYGLDLIKQNFPNVTVMYAACDATLNAEKFIVPGLGDFGDRYFGTETGV